jgi:hypothetical protein
LFNSWGDKKKKKTLGTLLWVGFVVNCVRFKFYIRQEVKNKVACEGVSRFFFFPKEKGSQKYYTKSIMKSRSNVKNNGLWVWLQSRILILVAMIDSRQ